VTAPAHPLSDPSEPRHWIDSDVEDAMQDEHVFIWQAILDTVDIDLRGTRVLDVGCNQGGFLRLLSDAADIGEGFGYDPAGAAVEIARSRRGDRPLTFEVASAPPVGWAGFDVAFSHEVLYLVHDLDAHAAAVREALLPGGIYYVAMGAHAGNSMMVGWHREYSKTLDMPPIYSLSEVASVFEEAGFEGSCRGLEYGFIPTKGHLEPDLQRWLDYYRREKVLFRFCRR
jgi:SAM-dependent methyltransferase